MFEHKRVTFKHRSIICYCICFDTHTARMFRCMLRSEHTIYYIVVVAVVCVILLMELFVVHEKICVEIGLYKKFEDTAKVNQGLTEGNRWLWFLKYDTLFGCNQFIGIRFDDRYTLWESALFMQPIKLLGLWLPSYQAHERLSLLRQNQVPQKNFQLWNVDVEML